MPLFHAYIHELDISHTDISLLLLFSITCHFLSFDISPFFSYRHVLRHIDFRFTPFQSPP